MVNLNFEFRRKVEKNTAADGIEEEEKRREIVSVQRRSLRIQKSSRALVSEDQ